MAGYTSDNEHPIDLERVFYLFNMLDGLLDADDGYLWGSPLHGPVVFVCAATRFAAANMPVLLGEILEKYEPLGLYVGIIPDGVIISDTISEFGGRVWGMVVWSESFIDETDNAMRLLIHELFHAWQFGGLFIGNPFSSNNTHADGLDARISILLEINALLYALRTDGDERTSAIVDALSIRAERRRQSGAIARNENIVEVMEGLAVYTDTVLRRDSSEDRIAEIELYAISWLNGSMPMQFFGYATGALYALLLDEVGADWRSGGIRWNADLGAILRQTIGLGITDLVPFSDIDLELYGYSYIRQIQEAWVLENERIVREAQAAFSGPVLLLCRDGVIDWYDPNLDIIARFIPWPDFYGSGIYELDYGLEGIILRDDMRGFDWLVNIGTFVYTADFGRLEVAGGVMMFIGRTIHRHEVPAYGIEIDGNTVTGSGWTLTLNNGFYIRTVGGVHFAIGGEAGDEPQGYKYNLNP